MSSITSVNAVLMITVDSIFNNPQQILDFATDDIYDSPPSALAEPRMGADGVLTGGLVYTMTEVTYHLQADSPSCAIFDTWWQRQLQNKDLYFAYGSITLQSVGTKWNMVKGILRTWKTAPDARRVLEPRAATVVWQSITPQPSNQQPNN